MIGKQQGWNSPRGSSCLGPGAWGRAKPGWHHCQRLPVPHGGQTNLLAQPGALTHPQTSLGWAFSTAGLAVLSCVGVSLPSQQGRHQPRAGRGTGELFWGFCHKNLGVTFISPLGFVRVGMDCSEIPCFQRRDRKSRAGPVAPRGHQGGESHNQLRNV